MTLIELGSLGEFLGGIAVVISLVYVGLQIKQNTVAVTYASERAVIDDANSWRAHLVENHEVAEIYRKGMTKPDSLDPVEWLRFRMLLDSLFDTWEYQVKSNQSQAQQTGGFVERTLIQPGGSRYWKEARPRFSADFVRYIDGLALRSETQK